MIVINNSKLVETRCVLCTIDSNGKEVQFLSKYSFNIDDIFEISGSIKAHVPGYSGHFYEVTLVRGSVCTTVIIADSIKFLNRIKNQDRFTVNNS